MSREKLVRDKIPNILLKLGKKPAIRIANRAEFWQKLKDKLVEESNEYRKGESLEELADVFEVLDAIVRFKKITKTSLNKVKARKAKERGSFKKSFILKRI